MPLRLNSSAATGGQKVFGDIYAKGLWRGSGPASGAGSSPFAARTTCLVLLEAIRRAAAERPEGSPVRILDAPCGDFTWMPGCLARARATFPRVPLRYTGADVVAELVRQLNAGHGHYLVNSRRAPTPAGVDVEPFLHLDAANVGAMAALRGRFDVLLSKHMLVHLPSEQVVRVLDGWSAVGARFVVTDDYPSRPNWSWLDPEMGFPYRMQNLREPPFSMRDPLCSQPDASFCHVHRMRCESNINLFESEGGELAHGAYDPADRAHAGKGKTSGVYEHARGTRDDARLRLCFNLSGTAEGRNYTLPRSQRLLGDWWPEWRRRYPRGLVREPASDLFQ